MLRTRMFTAVVLAGILAACQDSAGPAHEQESVQIRQPEEGFRTRGEARTGWIYNRSGQPSEVRYEVQGKLAIVEGDIIIGEVESIAPTRDVLLSKSGGRRNVFRDGTAYRWSGGVVPYVISANVPSQWRITDAMAHISANNPGVQFVPRSDQNDYVVVQRSSGCASPVGRIGGAQVLYLADGCSTGNTIHELLHALGMHHEQNRCNRDTYVTVHYENIDPADWHVFAKQCGTGYISSPYEYDEGSIMHYGAFAFTYNAFPTISSKRGLPIGQRVGMSALDIDGVAFMYPMPGGPLNVYIAGPVDVNSGPNCYQIYEAVVTGGAGGATYSWEIDYVPISEWSNVFSTQFPAGAHHVKVFVTDAAGTQVDHFLDVSSYPGGTSC